MQNGVLQYGPLERKRGVIRVETRETQKSKMRGINAIKKAVIMRSMVFFHYIVLVALFLCCWILFYRMPAEQGEYFVHNRTIAATYMLLLIVFSRIYAGYKVGQYRVSELVQGQFFANIMSWGVTYFMACIMAQKLLNPLMGFACLAVQVGLGMLWTVLMNKVYYRLHRAKRTVVFYRRRDDLQKIEELVARREKWQIEKYLHCQVHSSKDDLGDKQENIDEGNDVFEESIDGDIQKIIKVIDKYDAALVTGVNASLRNGIAKHCVETKKDCYFVPHTGDVMVAGATHMRAFSVPIFRIRRSSPSPEFLLIKRVFDVFASGAALLVLWPIMLIIAIAIRSYDHGPAFYKQTRLTKDGKTFQVLKFRSMKVSAESDGVARLATENDDRITPIGKIIRAIRFDELPQLINILKGDMSIVGPRPERPEIAEQYIKELPAFHLRLQVKAGLTGYAQVYGRYNTEPSDKLKMDLMYINNMGVIEDLRLIMATIRILFVKESTQGLAADSLIVTEDTKV